MSTVAINVQLPAPSQALVKKINQAPLLLPQAVARGMNRALEIIATRIQETRLVGEGPYPPAEHKLGIRSGQLRGSVRVTPAKVSGNEVTAAIGSSVVYARIHEFGGVIVPKKAKFLVFKIGKETIFAKKVVIPERAPFRTGLAENANFMREEISKEVGAMFSK